MHLINSKIIQNQSISSLDKMIGSIDSIFDLKIVSDSFDNWNIFSLSYLNFCITYSSDKISSYYSFNIKKNSEEILLSNIYDPSDHYEKRTLGFIENALDDLSRKKDVLILLNINADGNPDLCSFLKDNNYVLYKRPAFYVKAFPKFLEKN